MAGREPFTPLPMNQSTLDVGGVGADISASFTLVLVIGAVVIFAGMGAAIYAAWRSGAPADGERTNAKLVAWGGLALPATILMALVIYTTMTTLSLTAIGKETDAPLTITVVGKQYWWDVYYHNRDDGGAVRTANELALPVGAPLKFILKSDNVIHSFWLPSLAGKMDMIPGRTNTLMIEATEVGTYRGQCAEFCGIQHARMALEVEVLEPEAFTAWLASRAEPARAVMNPLAQRGRALFSDKGCAACHRVDGVAGEKAFVGPDLTHFGSRKLLGGGMWPNNTGHLSGWIVDAQGMKPGSNMPSYNALTGKDLRALTAYLEDLT